MPFSHEPPGRIADNYILTDAHERERLAEHFCNEVHSHHGDRPEVVEAVIKQMAGNRLEGSWRDHTSIHLCDGIDGSFYEGLLNPFGQGLCHEGRIGIIHIGHRRIDLDRIDQLGRNTIIDPQDVAFSMRSVGQLDFWFAGGGLKAGEFPSSEDGFRWSLTNALRKPVARLPPQKDDDIFNIGRGLSLLDVVHMLRREGKFRFPEFCYNEACRNRLAHEILFLPQRQADVVSQCSVCGSVQTELEHTNIPKLFSPFGSNEALWNRLMLLLERLRGLQVLLAQTPIVKVGQVSLSDPDGTIHGIGEGGNRTHVLVDGPLSLYGVGGGMVEAMRALIDGTLAKSHPEMPLLMGNIKSGLEKDFLDMVVRHWKALGNPLPLRGWAVSMPWTADTIIQRGSGWRGLMNDVGHSIFFVSARGQPFVVSVAIPQANPSEVETAISRNDQAQAWLQRMNGRGHKKGNLVTPDMRRWVATKLLAATPGTAQWKACARACALIEASEIILYPSGTSPQAEAHKHSSISRQSGERLVGFIRQARRRSGKELF